jgi:FkbM family methyltransferase
MPDHSTPSHTIPSPPDVTVVVPTKNAARTLAACLQSLRAQTYPCRTVVVDNGSTDSTRAIAEDGADAVLEIGPERSAQRNHGARTYPAEFVGFIDADMVLQPTVVAEAVAALRAGAGSVIVPERTVGSGFWVEVRAFERSFYDGSDAIEAARFFRWDVFDRAGGFDEQLTGAEDWDLSESARELAPVARTAAVIEHDEGTIGYLDACRKKAYYAEGVRRYVAKRGVSALRQAGRRPWVRQPQGLLNRRGAGLVALKAGEAVAVAVALGTALVTRLVGHAGRGRAADGQPAQSGLAEVRLSAPSPTTRARWPAPVVYRGRRLWRSVVLSVKVCRTMYHGGIILARLAVGFLVPKLAGDVMFASKDRLRLAAPARDWVWLPIVEVVVDDCYRLQELASELRGTACRVLDIGAHVGSFTVALAKAVPGAKVTAFEPSADRAAYLRRNVAGNGLEDRVAVVQAAVGGRAGRDMLIGGQTLLGSELVSGSVEADGDVVDVVGFDDVMRSIDGPVDLLKMDCEGGEYGIVASTSAATLRRIDRLVLEYHPAPPAQVAQLFATLAEAGLVERWRNDVVPGQLGTVSFGRTDH